EPRCERGTGDQVNSGTFGRSAESFFRIGRAAKLNQLRDRQKETSMQAPDAFLSLGQDLRYVMRSLRRNPVFTTTAIVAIALGIGLSTAVFSVVDRVLFRSLPYQDDTRLVSVGVTAPIERQEFMLGRQYFDWK